ncbi:MAG: NYN domain-containing protein [Dehalococcoidia bacterium]|nr:NYN domain-containing protein [Dehalococcoidia bacterium]
MAVQRVAAYIDGFNLYYGLKSKGWRRYYWLDPRRMLENLLQSDQELMMVRYFTARISAEPQNPGKPVRQNTFLEALLTLPDLHIHYGKYTPKGHTCPSCGATWQTYQEKMTDVNIAVALLGDAQDDAFDTGIVVSGDSDLVGPITTVRSRYSDKQVIVAFPPNRVSKQLREVATASFVIGRKTLHDSQFPDCVARPDGHVLTRPPSWY